MPAIYADHEVSYGIQPEAKNVLTLLSEGYTTNQVSEELDLERRRVDHLKKEAVTFFGVESVSAAVGMGIVSGDIEISPEPSPSVVASFTVDERLLLNYFAHGGEADDFAKIAQLEPRLVNRRYDKLLQRLGATTRPYGVRRTFELGIASTGRANHE